MTEKPSKEAMELVGQWALMEEVGHRSLIDLARRIDPHTAELRERAEKAERERDEARLKADNAAGMRAAELAENERLRTELAASKNEVELLCKSQNVRLDGYRELGQKVADAENQRDEARAAFDALRAEAVAVLGPFADSLIGLFGPSVCVVSLDDARRAAALLAKLKERRGFKNKARNEQN